MRLYVTSSSAAISPGLNGRPGRIHLLLLLLDGRGRWKAFGSFGQPFLCRPMHAPTKQRFDGNIAFLSHKNIFPDKLGSNCGPVPLLG